MNYGLIIALCCLAINLSVFCKDIYIPSMPAIADSMHCSQAVATQSVTWFLVGMGVSQLFFGPLSDYWGRKKTILLGISLCLIGNLISIDVNNMPLFLTYRLLAGVGAGACVVIPRAIAGDLYRDSDLTKAISWISMATVITPMLAPWMGGMLQQHYNWHACFVFVTLLTLGCLIAFYTLYKETKTTSAVSMSITSLYKNCITLLTSPIFLVYSTLSVVSLSSNILYLIFSPFIFQKMFALTPVQNGFMYILSAIGYFCGAMTVNRLTTKYRDDSLLFAGLLFCMVSASIILIQCVFFTPTLWLLPCMMLFNALGSGILTPIANKQVISIDPRTIGTASALIGFMRLIGSFGVSYLATSFGVFTPKLLAISLLGLALIGIVTHAIYLMYKVAYFTEVGLGPERT